MQLANCYVAICNVVLVTLLNIVKTQNQIEQAVTTLQRGGVIAYPTESVFGLGCDPDNLQAVQKILDLKQRAIEKGLILVASSFQQLEKYLQPVKPEIQQRVLASWPGPYTWLWPVKDDVPALLCGQHTTLAVRVSAHPVVQALCTAYGKAIVSTSANLADNEPARNIAEVREYFDDKLDFIVDADIGESAQPTEIRDAITNNVIRSG